MASHDHKMHHGSESTLLEYIKFASVVVSICAISWLLHESSDTKNLLDFARLFMGVFLTVFALFKLVGYKMFVQMFPMYDLIAKRAKFYSYAFPFIELLLGASFLFNWAETWRSIAVIILMGIGAISIFNEVYLKRRKIHCACLGNIIKLPLSTVSLFENVLMVAMAVFMLAYTPTPTQTDAVNNVETPEASFNFAAVGDFGDTPEAELVLGAIAGVDPAFTAALGDLGYVGNGDEPEWCAFVTNIIGTEHPFQIVVGNHDDGSKDGDLLEYLKCLPNKMDGVHGEYGIEYYFDYDDLARFIMISPDIDNYGFDYNRGGEHYEWVESAIDDAHDQGLPWVFLGMHKNCQTLGVKNCEIGEDIINLAIEAGVDVVLQGHEHAYSRSKQLAFGEGCSAIEADADNINADCISGEGNIVRKGNGTIIVVSGAGGRELRDVDLDDDDIGYFETWNGANVGRSHGFTLFTVEEDLLQAQFVPVNGDFTDRFEIAL